HRLDAAPAVGQRRQPGDGAAADREADVAVVGAEPGDQAVVVDGGQGGAADQVLEPELRPPVGGGGAVGPLDRRLVAGGERRGRADDVGAAVDRLGGGLGV